MPVYNSDPRYLDAAVEVILWQTFEDFEVILADNASSSEESRDRYAARRDRRVRYARHSTNQGAIANFKYVMTEAQGEVFAWVADDDLHQPTFLEKGVKLLAKEPQLNPVTSRTRWAGSSDGDIDVFIEESRQLQ